MQEMFQEQLDMKLPFEFDYSPLRNYSFAAMTEEALSRIESIVRSMCYKNRLAFFFHNLQKVFFFR